MQGTIILRALVCISAIHVLLEVNPREVPKNENTNKSPGAVTYFLFYMYLRPGESTLSAPRNKTSGFFQINV